MNNLFFYLSSLFLILLFSFQAIAQSPSVLLIKQTGGLSSPVQVTHAGDGSGRIFIVEQLGRIRILRNQLLEPTPFLDISGRVLFGGERGLLSVAFPPGFPQKGYFYVNYTRTPDGATVVARYFIMANNPDLADPNSEQIILIVDQPFPNHNGGQLAFGPNDGFLYIGMGDGGSGGDPLNLAQNLNDLPGNRRLLGKLLRIDVETAGCAPYCIPGTNPLLNGVRSEIWALGLRNPFRFSFDRQTGDLYIGDVGQNLFEEVNFQPANSPGGENYGWNIMEGLHCFNTLDFFTPLPSCNQTGLTLPVFEYGHTQGNCSVTGGFVYRGNLHPRMKGTYIYGDYCSGRIWGLSRNNNIWQTVLLLDSSLQISSFGEDQAGELYVTDYSNGDIYRIANSFVEDFDGDGKTDQAFYRPETGVWFVLPSSTGSYYGEYFGAAASDILVPGDYDGDGKTDYGFYRPSNGVWYIKPSGGVPSWYAVYFGGGASDIPIFGDFDGDGKTDQAFYRPSTGVWFVLPSGGGSYYGTYFGAAASDILVPGDYDGDGKTDLAFYRPSTGVWFILPSGGGSWYAVYFGGGASDIPIFGDFDGDGKTDQAFYRPSTGVWFVLPSGGGSYYGTYFGAAASDILVPGDYDGDGKTDLAFYRPSTGVWFIKPSGGSPSWYAVYFGGGASDIPLTYNY